jgi:Integrase core domain
MPSIGSVGDAYDNAVAESFFASLEREVLDRRRFKSQAEAKMAIFEWIEGWYNPHRRHSSLGYRLLYDGRRSPDTTFSHFDSQPEQIEAPARFQGTSASPLCELSLVESGFRSSLCALGMLVRIRFMHLRFAFIDHLGGLLLHGSLDLVAAFLCQLR